MDILNIGTLVNTHGLKGEVKIKSDSDFKDIRFGVGRILIIEFGKQMLEFEIKSYRVHKGLDMVTFEGVTNINDVEKFKGCKVFSYDDVEVELDEDELLISDLMDSTVVTIDGEELGIVTEVFNTGSNDILRVKGNKNCLIPFIESVVQEVDVENKKIVIEVIEGLID